MNDHEVIHVRGHEMPLAKACEALGVSAKVISVRMEFRGETAQQAFEHALDAATRVITDMRTKTWDAQKAERIASISRASETILSRKRPAETSEQATERVFEAIRASMTGQTDSL